jgi:DNA (cytosine-5)-methyltransferase 1
MFAAASTDRRRDTCGKQLAVAGLFTGVGGIELGLHRAGHETLMVCENEPGARAVLHARFPDIPLHDDVCKLVEFPEGTELVAGGFPCQDLSQAGQTAGISGARSGLVGEVFRLLERRAVPWVLLENVPFMLQLKRGEALAVVVDALDRLGYDWAYRVVDSRAMGVPQRRERVYLLASKVGDPRDVLFVDDAGDPGEPSPEEWRSMACGFYWTEGIRGLGWAYDAVPTLKGGSTIGIPSPPAIVLRSGEIVKPDIRDCERMQGFEPEWTKPAEAVTRRGHRWKLVGNAVTVDVAEWIGSRLRSPDRYDPTGDEQFHRRGAWPRAVWSVGGRRYVAAVSAWPFHRPRTPLEAFLQYRPCPLSLRAAEGFLKRTQKGSLRFPPGFIDLVREHAHAV